MGHARSCDPRLRSGTLPSPGGRITRAVTTAKDDTRSRRQTVPVREPMPPVAAVVSFIDGINRGDVAHLASLMTDDHGLHVFDEPPLLGKRANIDAWEGYRSSFPEYVIYPSRIASRGTEVVVWGHTTGSHLGLPDEDERQLTLLWRAVVHDGRLELWQLIEDTPERRSEFGVEWAIQDSNL